MAGYESFIRVGIDPSLDMTTDGFESRQGQYRYYWHLYSNTIFDDVIRWYRYKQAYRLYRNARSIYNPFKRLVDVYAGQIYGGIITEDGLPLPDGTPSAIPLDPAIDENLRLAFTQIWKWSNFQAGKSLYARFGAALGDVLMEVVDDLEREKVWLQIWWPGFVTDLELDPQGNIKAYTLDYEVKAPAGATGTAKQNYKYRKEVTQETISYYRDGKPYDYGSGSSAPNPYGFAPAVWVNHQFLGAAHGANVWEGSQNKLEEANGLISRIHDQIHKSVSSPRIFWTNSRITSLLHQTKRPAGEMDEITAPDADRESTMLLKGPLDGRTESLLGDLDIASSFQYIESLMHEIEADHPELNMWQELRGMQEVSGPAAIRLSGDTVPRIYEAAANYDRGLLAASQMAVAIAGQRVVNGDWGHKQTNNPTDESVVNGLSLHQQRFQGFDLMSWDKGDLDALILPRQILPTTIDEKLVQAQTKLALGVDTETLLEEIGYDRASITRITKNKKKAADEAAQRQADMFSSGNSTSAAFGSEE
jgi:hypothetical protein